MKQAIENAVVWDGERVIERGSIRIEDGLIAAVGPTAGSRFAADETIDAEGRLAIPGFINAHTHLYSSLARGLSLPGYAPQSFTQILEQLWWRLDKAFDDSAVTTSALVGAMEAARCGVTTLVDHHASPNAIPGSLDRVRDAVCRRVGLRAALCYETSDRDGDERALLGIQENARFLATLDPQDSLCSGLFGLHASLTLGDGTLRAVAAKFPDGAGIHIHVAEGPEDEPQCVKRHGVRIVPRLDGFGLLRPRSILAHCLHVDADEKDLIAKRDAIVVHNPRSNMNNAVGTFDLDGFLDRGILAGLGTDGLGANMLAELFTAGLAQRQARQDALAGAFPQLDRLLFENNPAIAERVFGVRTGRLVPGAPADIAVLDYAAPTPLAEGNVLGHLLFGVAVHALRVSDLFVGGHPILRKGLFVDLDEREEYAHAREEARRLWKRIA
ncbi:MAG: putative aminohydrolase SsnA [Candidatus Bipolaricaulota bacterium]|nr:putative aminohydrolase SsnA [Candidatus Bipolaricaulota bacterium]